MSLRAGATRGRIYAILVAFLLLPALGLAVTSTASATPFAGTPKVSVSPASLTFPAKGSGPLGLGLTSAAQTVTVKNTGTVPLVMGYGDVCGGGANPCLEGSYFRDYSIPANTCGDNTIPVGGTCTFTIAFTPSTTNQEVGSVNIYDNAAGSPQSVALTGQGTAAKAQISPSRLSFFTKKVQTTSAAQTVTVKNNGTVPLVMGYGDVCGAGANPCVEGSYASDYSIPANSCVYHTIPIGDTCTFSVDFTPTTSNEETGSINIYDNTAGSPQSIALSGLATAATVSVSAKTLSFPAAGSGPLGLGVASAAQKVTVTNTGKVSVQMGYGSPTGADPSISTTYGTDFAITGNTCAGHTIPAGTTCTFSVKYTASTLNDEVGSLTIYDNAVGGPQTISLSGQATAAQAKLSASKLTFSSPAVGTKSAPQKVTVSNTGTVPLLMGFGSPSGGNPSVTGSYAKDFTITGNDCANFAISVGTTCTFSVEFTPSTSNHETGTVLIYGNTADSPQQIALQGAVSG